MRVAGHGPSDDSSESSEGSLSSVIDNIDERAGYAAHKGQRSYSRQIVDHDPGPDSIDPIEEGLCSEIGHGTRAARLALDEALPRVSDAIAAQRIEAAIALLDRALSQILRLEAWLNNPEQVMK